MLRVRGGIAALASLLAAAALALAGVPALADGVADGAADTADVAVDYRVDAVIDGSYTVATLRGALADHEGDITFAAAVQGELDGALLGARTSPASGAAPVSAAVTPPLADAGAAPLRRTQERAPAGASPASSPPAWVGGLGLSEPAPGVASALPWPLLALSALAGLLAVSGLSASLYRRARRPSRLTQTP